jgi:hypothetical protein
VFAELVLALKTRVHTGNRRSVGLYCCRLCGGDVFLSVSRHFRLDVSALWLGSCFFRSRRLFSDRRLVLARLHLLLYAVGD